MSSKAKVRAAAVAVLVAVSLSPISAYAGRCAQKAPLSTAVQTTSETFPDCSDVLLLSRSDYDALRNPFGAEDIDFVNVRWSLGAALLMWVSGIGVGFVINVVRKSRI